jgi:ribonuclease HIII
MVVFTGVEYADIKFLLKKGFIETKPKTIHEITRFTKGVRKKVFCILYHSGKLFLQGDVEIVERAAKLIRSANIGSEIKPINFREELGRVIGSDESLKGDTFGGLVIAAVKGDDEIREKLIAIGVGDSKRFSDKEILRMAEEIKKIANCFILNLYPEEYNKEGSVTDLLNRMHQGAAAELFPGYHVVDKYPGCRVGDFAEVKAESKWLAVAAASVLARAAAVKQLNNLSKKAGFTVPKGSTHVAWALQELQERGLNPREFVKLKFKNVQKFFNF